MQILNDAIGFGVPITDESKVDTEHFCKVAKNMRSELSILIRC